MSSNILTTIDQNYPVAGQDNDTQGFRDNFATIKNSFEAAKAEIEELQSKTVLKQAINDTELVNDLSGNSIIQANLQRKTEQFFEAGTVSSSDPQDSRNIDFQQGHYQKFKIDNNLIMNLTGFSPVSQAVTNNLKKVTVELSNNGSDVTVTFNNLLGTLFTSSSWATRPNASEIATNQVFLGSETNPTIIEFWSYNGGITIFANFLGQFNAVSV